MADSTPLSVHTPTGTPKGAVVVIQEAFGVNDHIEDVCRRFAEEDWLAVAPHLFHRTGDPKLGYDDFSVIMPHMQALTKDGVLADVDAAPGLRAPWLGLFGDLDKGIPVEHVEELRGAAARSGQPTQVVRYPDADHGFHCDQRESYHASSATDAWNRALAWFGHYLKD